MKDVFIGFFFRLESRKHCTACFDKNEMHFFCIFCSTLQNLSFLSHGNVKLKRFGARARRTKKRIQTWAFKTSVLKWPVPGPNLHTNSQIFLTPLQDTKIPQKDFRV
jgi:hypothetical protein